MLKSTRGASGSCNRYTRGLRRKKRKPRLIGPRRGAKLSEETKLKMRMAKLGKQHSIRMALSNSSCQLTASVYSCTRQLGDVSKLDEFFHILIVWMQSRALRCLRLVLATPSARRLGRRSAKQSRSTGERQSRQAKPSCAALCGLQLFCPQRLPSAHHQSMMHGHNALAHVQFRDCAQSVT